MLVQSSYSHMQQEVICHFSQRVRSMYEWLYERLAVFQPDQIKNLSSWQTLELSAGSDSLHYSLYPCATVAGTNPGARERTNRFYIQLSDGQQQGLINRCDCLISPTPAQDFLNNSRLKHTQCFNMLSQFAAAHNCAVLWQALGVRLVRRFPFICTLYIFKQFKNNKIVFLHLFCSKIICGSQRSAVDRDAQIFLLAHTLHHLQPHALCGPGALGLQRLRHAFSFVYTISLIILTEPTVSYAPLICSSPVNLLPSRSRKHHDCVVRKYIQFFCYIKFASIINSNQKQKWPKGASLDHPAVDTHRVCPCILSTLK